MRPMMGRRRGRTSKRSSKTSSSLRRSGCGVLRRSCAPKWFCVEGRARRAISPKYRRVDLRRHGIITCRLACRSAGFGCQAATGVNIISPVSGNGQRLVSPHIYSRVSNFRWLLPLPLVPDSGSCGTISCPRLGPTSARASASTPRDWPRRADRPRRRRGLGARHPRLRHRAGRRTIEGACSQLATACKSLRAQDTVVVTKSSSSMFPISQDRALKLRGASPNKKREKGNLAYWSRPAFYESDPRKQRKRRFRNRLRVKHWR